MFSPSETLLYWVGKGCTDYSLDEGVSKFELRLPLPLRRQPNKAGPRNALEKAKLATFNTEHIHITI